jgi:hypothetical protein
VTQGANPSIPTLLEQVVGPTGPVLDIVRADAMCNKPIVRAARIFQLRYPNLRETEQRARVWLREGGNGGGVCSSVHSSHSHS